MATVGSVTKFFATANETGTLTLTSTTSGGTATVPVTGLASSYSNGDIVALVVNPGTGTQQVFIGEVSGSSVINAIWSEGSNVSHSAGATIIDYWTATHQAALVKGLLVEHTQAGHHSDITATSITTTGNSDVGGNADVEGTLHSDGAFSTDSTTATRKDQSGNDIAIDPVYRNEGFQGFDYVATGLVSTTSSGLTAAISAGTYYIAGKRYTYAGGTKLLTASKDSYLDINTAGTITEVTATIGAASPALTANSVRIAKILTAGAAITSHNTGGVLATAFDSIGNRIRRTDPHDRIIGYFEITSTFSTAATSATQITSLSTPAIIPSATSVITAVLDGPSILLPSNVTSTLGIWDGTVGSGTRVAHKDLINSAGAAQENPHTERSYTPGAAGLKTFNGSLHQSSGSSGTLNADATQPTFVKILLESR